VTFDVNGPGCIIGVGNGDPTCHEPDKGNSRSLFNGLAQIIVQTGTSPGRITLTARSPGLRDAVLAVDSSSARPRPFAAVAEPRHFITDWRMGPVSPGRPNVDQVVADSDMNTWQRVQAGSAVTTTPGYVLLRATVKPPKAAQMRGGQIVFREITGRGEVFLDGSPIAAKSDPSPAEMTLTFGPAQQHLELSVLVYDDAAPVGLTRSVELIAAPCVTS